MNDEETLLSELDPNSGVGGGGLHPRFSWKFFVVLRSDLSILYSIVYNCPLQSGSLPTQWFSAIAIPIFQKSFGYDPPKYRPISLTYVTYKVLERAFARDLKSYLEVNSYFSATVWIL